MEYSVDYPIGIGDLSFATPCLHVFLETSGKKVDGEKTAMTEIISILVAVVLGLFGLNVMKSNKIRNQKKEIKTKDEVITRKKEELKTINEVQNKIKEAESAPKPEEKAPPEVGDVASRLERLNRLHNN